MGLVKEDQVLKALGEQLGMKVVKLADITIPAELTELVNESMATAYKIVPVSQNKKDKSITVAMAEPQNPSTLDSLKMFLSTEVKGAIAVRGRRDGGHRAALRRATTRASRTSSSRSSKTRAWQRWPAATRTRSTWRRSKRWPRPRRCASCLNMVLLLAIKDKASDIHFEPFEEEYKMRYRVDGVLYELVPPPRHLAPAIASRIKVMSNLDIAERRLPQDGRIQLALGGNEVDIRVSTLPTHVRRERRPADPRPHGRAARPEEAGHARGHAEDRGTRSSRSPTASSW